VQAHAHPHRNAVRPVLLDERALRGDRSGDGVARAREGEEERVTLRVDLLPAGRAQCLAQDAALAAEDVRVQRVEDFVRRSITTSFAAGTPQAKTKGLWSRFRRR
jgi:hypothetical protein